MRMNPTFYVALMALWLALASTHARADALSLTLTRIETASEWPNMDALRALARMLPPTDVLLQDLDRPERLALLQRGEVINDLPATLSTQLVAPMDQRATTAFDVKTLLTPPSAVVMVAHLDMLGPGDMAADALHALAASARRGSGNLGFEVWREQAHSNHFDLVGSWTDLGAYQRFEASAAARSFRRSVANSLGSPYDAHLYHSVATP